MAAGDTLQGRRYQDVEDPHEPHDRMEPGGYRRAAGEWECVAPDGSRGNLSAHEVTEHKDGTITVSPSILIRGGRDVQQELWHGYLEHGVWRSV
jgi:hypothetical protein